MSAARPSSSVSPDRAAIIHREILQIGVLLLVAVVAFLVTRAVAASNRKTNLENAAEWYDRGQIAIEAGRVEEAADAFRRASVRNRGDRRYVLALSRALAAGGDLAAARNALLTLRESAPEDPEINLELARHAAQSQAVAEALRFYYNALYAPWPAGQEAARRAVRFELIRFLLASGDQSRALSELLAVSTDLPDDVVSHVQVGELFARAGDHALALEHFQRALRVASQNEAALAGAAQAAFELGQYALARRFLLQVPTNDDLQRTREVVDLVLSRDPLAARVGSAERLKRLVANFSYAEQRWDGCAAARAADGSAALEPALRVEAGAFAEHLKRLRSVDQDVVAAGVDMINRLEQRVVERCGPPTALDSALLLIGRRYGADPR